MNAQSTCTARQGDCGIRMTTLPREVMEYFPYPSVRPHQDQFINTVFTAVKERKSVLIEGSNGLGKTISALSACLPTAIEKDLKILYVARTHRQHDRVIEELRAVFKKRPITGISLRGRAEMCLNAFASRSTYDTKSLMEVCEMLKARADAHTIGMRMSKRTSTSKCSSRYPLAHTNRLKSSISAVRRKSAPTNS